jgi:hypothetical protein
VNTGEILWAIIWGGVAWLIVAFLRGWLERLLDSRSD